MKGTSFSSSPGMPVFNLVSDVVAIRGGHGPSLARASGDAMVVAGVDVFPPAEHAAAQRTRTANLGVYGRLVATPSMTLGRRFAVPGVAPNVSSRPQSRLSSPVSRIARPGPPAGESTLRCCSGVGLDITDVNASSRERWAWFALRGARDTAPVGCGRPDMRGVRRLR